MVGLGIGLVPVEQLGCKSTRLCEASDSKRGPGECSLLPLASCSLNLKNNPSHCVASTSMLSTDESRFLHDSCRTVGMGCSW